MSKRKIGIGSISLLLVIIALIWSYNIFGFCLGDKVLSNFNLPTWSNGNNEQIVNTFSIVTFDNKGQGNHYTDRKSTRLNSSHIQKSRMPSSA